MRLFFRVKNTGLIYFCLLLVILSACRKSPQTLHVQALKQDPYVQVFFNHDRAGGAEYTDPYRNIKRSGDNLEQIIIDEINSATSNIDIAVQEFRLPNIALALAERAQAGVKIRVILENTYSRPLSQLTSAELDRFPKRERDRYQDFLAFIDRNKDGVLSDREINERDALVILKGAKIPTIDDTADGSRGAGLMHHKFTVIDGNTVLVGSANYTMSDIHGDFNRPQTRGNVNNLLRIKNSQLASLFTEEFNLMWGDGLGEIVDSKFGNDKPIRNSKEIAIGDVKITLQFSPSSSTVPWSFTSNGLIASKLKKAQSAIELALFVFSEQKLANVLELEHQQGVKIKALIDPEFAFRDYSEGLDMLGVAVSEKCKYESDNHPWQAPITTVGIPQLPIGDKLHHKFGIIDNNVVITGSHNWSAAANYQNDETLLIVQSSTIAAHFIKEFERLYQDAVLGIPISVKKALNADAKQCSSVRNITPALETEELSLININTATQSELESLPGIGSKLARRIIEARQQKPFSSLEDLKRVSGIKSNILNKIEDKVTF
jgi:competence ComEA-like helix-hairpin-helix protein